MAFITFSLHHTLYILFLTVGGLLILNKMIFRFSNKSGVGVISISLISIITFFSVWGYTRFGEFHDYGNYGKHPYHYSEIYSYAMGAKYFKELGYFGIYDFTYVGMRELQNEGVQIPKIYTIRSLKDIDVPIPADIVYLEQKDKYLSHFSPERWKSFKNDIKTFLSFGCIDSMWQPMLYDLGFNSPPTWVTFASGWVANLFPFTQKTMEHFAFIDMFLVIILAGYFVFRSFGFYPFCAYLIVFGTNGVASYAWTGGSFFRQDWFCSLVLALCFMKEENYMLSGVFFGLSTCLRAFPLFFFVGAAWSLLYKVYKDRALLNNFLVFSLSGALTMLLLFYLSVCFYGIGCWHDFLEKIINHNNQFFVNHICYKKFFVFSKDIGNQNFWFDEGLRRFLIWQGHLEQLILSKYVLFNTIKFTMLASSLIIALTVPVYLASFIVGGTLLFFFAMPACYYYVYLAIVPALFFSLSGRWTDVLRMALIFVLLIYILITPFLSNDDIIENGYINTMVFYFWVAIHLTFWVEISQLKLKDFITYNENQRR